MGFLARIDHEHAAAMSTLPPPIDWNDVAGSREAADRLILAASAGLPQIEGVSSERVDLGDDGPAVVVYRPDDLGSQTSSVRGGLVWIHGGGFVSGSAARDDRQCRLRAQAANCVVVSVDYRLAPEHPFPTPLDDCLMAYRWVIEQATALGIDPARLAIGGASAGGGLAASLAVSVRDLGGPRPCLLLLVYPMLDHRSQHPSFLLDVPAGLWTRSDNEQAWRNYLDGAFTDPSAAAVPALATDLAHLPPTFITVGDLDVLLDECLDFARRLIRAEVPIELHVHPGAFHGSALLVPQAQRSRRWNAELVEVLVRHLHPG